MLLYLFQELTEEGLPFVILFHDPSDTDTAEKYRQVVTRDLFTEKCMFTQLCCALYILLLRTTSLNFNLTKMLNSVLATILCAWYVIFFYEYVFKHICCYTCLIYICIMRVGLNITLY